MALKRTITGLIVAIVWVTALSILPLIALFAILVVAMIICMVELSRMIRKAGYLIPTGTICICGFAWLTYCYAIAHGYVPPLGEHTSEALFALIAFTLFMRVMLDKTIKKPLETLAISIMSYIYIPYFLSFLLRLTTYPFNATEINQPASILIILFMISIVKMSDAGGYFIGTAFGKHKLIPRLSPGKSWEGLVGGLVFSLVTAVGFSLVAQSGIFPAMVAISNLSLCEILVITVLLVIVGLWGDLLESLIKRAGNVKDSSGVFPGMGGFLDTFDSLIFTPAVLYYALIWLGA